MKATRILALIATLVFAITLFAQAAHADEADKARGAHEAVASDGSKTVYLQREGKLASIEDGNLIDRARPISRTVLSAIEVLPGIRDGAGLGTDSVIGADDRVRINPTTSYPWRAIAHLAITNGNGTTGGCTGWFIGPHTVATAGHCVFNHDRGGWARSITVTPGRNGSATPFGSQVSTNFRSVLGWTRDRNTNYDYGAIILPNDNLGNAVGWFGFAALSDSSLNGMTANLSGYPGDKPFGTQWFHARQISSVDSRRVYYQIDTFNGQSGSPVWRYLNGQRHGVAIHTNGTGGCGGSNNCGTRIVQPVFDNLLAWKQ